jgi:hypothetical protein
VGSHGIRDDDDDAWPTVPAPDFMSFCFVSFFRSKERPLTFLSLSPTKLGLKIQTIGGNHPTPPPTCPCIMFEGHQDIKTHTLMRTSENNPPFHLNEMSKQICRPPPSKKASNHATDRKDLPVVDAPGIGCQGLLDNQFLPSHYRRTLRD